MFDKIITKDMLTEIGIRMGVVLAKKEQFIKLDTTQYKFLSHMITGLIYFFGLLMAIYSVPAPSALRMRLLWAAT